MAVNEYNIKWIKGRPDKKRESLADADKPAWRESMQKPIRRVSFHFTEFNFAEFQITNA